MSPKSAGLAVKMGYSNVKVYLEGDPYWQESGRYLVPTDEFVLEGNIILVDLRDADEVAKSHIPRAVNIPIAELEDEWEQFPRIASAPIVFYGAEEDVTEAVQLLREWGYRTVSGIDGGLERWVAAGHPTESGPAASEIVWQRKLGEGEVPLSEFEQVMSGQRQDAVILDVRGADEVADGMLTGAIHIPLDELEGRVDELPADKQILVYCSTGARAEMAQTMLVKADINAVYGPFNVDCENGDCTITE